MSSNSHEGQLFDGMSSTSVKTNSEAFPWIQVSMSQQLRVTMVALLSGEEQLMNLDIRVGDTDLSGQEGGGSMWISDNERCGKYFGPTLVAWQWVTVDCGYERGIPGTIVTLQLTERFRPNNPLEVAELEVPGWGSICVEKN